MKTRIYLRVAKTEKKPKVAATLFPTNESLTNGSKYNLKYYPTVLVALDLDIPDKEFDTVRILLDAKIKEVKPAVEIKQVIEEKIE